jgi:hypothetical protein
LRLVESGAVVLEEPAAFDSFSFVGAAAPDAGMRAALEETGVRFSSDDAHAFVDPGLVERLAQAAAVDDSWAAGFAKMTEYAKSKGWIGADGAVRAHTVWDR